MNINSHNAYTDLVVVLFFLERCEEIFTYLRKNTDKQKKYSIPIQLCTPRVLLKLLKDV